MTKISVYIDTGTVFTYDVPNETKAREHASAIIETGYRHSDKETPHILEWFPPHRIVKVKCEGGMTTKYTDSAVGT